MSITSPDDRTTTYAPVTPTTEFAADFPVFDNDDLKVFVDGEERVDFAVSATYHEGISTDARAVFADGVTGTVQVIGARDPHRTNRFLHGGPLPTRDVNLAFDTMEAEAQEARRDIDAARGRVENLINIHSDLIGQGNVPIFSAVQVLPDLTIPAGMNVIRLNGYYNQGDGGGWPLAIEVLNAGPLQPWQRLSDGGTRRWELLADMPNEKMFGAVGDDATDDTAAVLDLVSWAMNDPTRRKVSLIGRVYCASDIPDFHKVQWSGPGSIRIGTGPEFFPEPNGRNRGFNGLGFNTLYLNPQLGDDSNSGLASEFPLSAGAQLNLILGKYGSRLAGYWAVEFSGVITEEVSTWLYDTPRGAPIYMRGPMVDAWDNTDKPDDPIAITGITSANPPVVTATGNGMANGEKVFIALAKKSGGFHPADGAIYTVANVATNTFELQGVDGAGWAAYTGGGYAVRLHKSRPLLWFYGAEGTDHVGLTIDGNKTVDLRNMGFLGCGKTTGGGQGAGLRARKFCDVTGANLHALFCDKGFMLRDRSVSLISSGHLYGNDTGAMVLNHGATIGSRTPAPGGKL